MRMLDLCPIQGTFSPGDPIRLVAKIETDEPGKALLRLSLFHLVEKGMVIETWMNAQTGINEILLEFDVHSDTPRGYGVQANLANQDGKIVSTAETAFDVLSSWTNYPRYGFLSDFFPDREDARETIADLARYHINGLQFYDWQYRHDQYLSPTEIYVDPMGRRLSLNTVRAFIREAQQHGIAAMPYLAIYGASKEFWITHPQWRLHNSKGEPLLFENILGLMNPSLGSPWVEHLLNNCESMLDVLDFDGLHIDQYGDPKVGFDVEGKEVDIPLAFYRFIIAAKERLPEAALTFNAVGNWPIDALSSAPLDFNYIEIWSETPTFQDLRQIAIESRVKSDNRPLVMALYLPANQETTIRLADAIIFASGACRIELGERGRLLTDPYFPHHQPIPPDLIRILRRYYDFAVRYSEWIGPFASDLHDHVVTLPEGVWGIIRLAGGWWILHLINMAGLDQARWDEPIPAPASMCEFPLETQISERIRGVWWASPDRWDLALTPTEWRVVNGSLVINVPQLDYWTMVAIQIE